MTIHPPSMLQYCWLHRPTNKNIVSSTKYIFYCVKSRMLVTDTVGGLARSHCTSGCYLLIVVFFLILIYQ